MHNLMDMSPELWMQIFTHVFRDKRNAVELWLYNRHYVMDDSMPMTNFPQPESRKNREFRWAPMEYDFDHSLFLTCKEVRREALDSFRITFSITKRMRAKCVRDERGKLVPVRFIRKNDEGLYHWTELDEAIPDGVINDDYRQLLSPQVREHINVLNLNSYHGLNCDHINKDQFPRLELIAVEEIIDTRLWDFEYELTL